MALILSKGQSPTGDLLTLKEFKYIKLHMIDFPNVIVEGIILCKK